MPDLDTFKAVLEPTAPGREISTTQAYVRFLTQLLRDKELGPRTVPILVDEARTFGMEGLFRQIGIYNPAGQKYTPVDKDQVMYDKEDKAGQILQEGINEAGGMSHGLRRPLHMFDQQPHHDPVLRLLLDVWLSTYWRFGVGCRRYASTRLFVGRHLRAYHPEWRRIQHEDGHSHILASTIPNCISYDPTFAHEVAVILHHGLKRMVEQQENVYFYLTLLNENYPMPGLKEGTEEQIIKGMYLLEEGTKKTACDLIYWAAARFCAEEHCGQGHA